MPIPRQLTVIAFGVLLLSRLAFAAGSATAFQVPEDGIQFQFYPEPALVFVTVNSSTHPIEGNFAFEIVDVTSKDQHYEDSVFVSSQGTFKEEPGHTTEELPWPLKNLPSTELSLGRNAPAL